MVSLLLPVLAALPPSAGALATRPSAAPAAPQTAPAPAPAPTPAPTAGGGDVAGAGERQPTPEQLAAQARAEQLHEQLREQAGAAETARADLGRASAAAAAALERYRGAVLAQQEAQLDAAEAQTALQRAQQDVDEHRRVLGRWAWRVYVDGDGGLTDSPAMITLLDGGTTGDLSAAKAWLQSIGEGQVRALDDLRAATERQAAALEVATAAQERADGDAVAAAAAREAADAAVAGHRAALERLQRAYDTTKQQAAEADEQARVLALAGTWSDGSDGSSGLGGSVPIGQVGDCAGGDVQAYPNGRLPTALLCPLPGAPGKLLRADAAYAFTRMSRAYQATFGRPICVTSAYRSYEDQVRVAAERPGFAARPGRSNHGWGTATDLCGGIDRFGTPTHAWMLANAPLFGWFHPAWAGPGGSLPEPWHWEFGG